LALRFVQYNIYIEKRVYYYSIFDELRMNILEYYFLANSTVADVIGERCRVGWGEVTRSRENIRTYIADDSRSCL